MKARSNVTIAIPVGPLAIHAKWLDECLQSVVKQDAQPWEIILIDDMHNLKASRVDKVLGYDIPRRIYRAPWHLGVAHAFNFGVALSTTNLVITLGADDTLAPDCISSCLSMYNRLPVKIRDLTYYYMGVRYMDNDSEQYQPCQAAMVTKRLWQHTGGLPVEAATGASDAALGSILIGRGNEAGYLCCVDDKKTIYNYRRHPDTDTAQKGPWQGVIINTRDLVTRFWQVPDWGRYFD